jgi:transposase
VPNSSTSNLINCSRCAWKHDGRCYRRAAGIRRTAGCDRFLDVGSIRAALLIALLQTPHRFRTKRQLWAYSGLAVTVHSSADYRFVNGQLQRTQNNSSVRGLNDNRNAQLKNVFKGMALSASFRPGPWRDYYLTLLHKGMKPTLARLTLARKMAAITLTVWKKGERFDPTKLNLQVA